MLTTNSVFKGRKVLVIDDSLTVVKSLSKILKEVGILVIECSDGSEAVRLAIHQEPDLILLDLVMPKVGGIHVLKEMRSQRVLQNRPVIMITAKREEEHLVEALEAGADDYITKPFQEAVLLARIRTQLRNWQLLSDLNKANKFLLEAKDREVSAERWRTAVEMAGAAAHKLNQPLTSIVCYADMLLKKLDPKDDAFKPVKSIYEESERMTLTLRKMSAMTSVRSSEYVGDTTILEWEQSNESSVDTDNKKDSNQ